MDRNGKGMAVKIVVCYAKATSRALRTASGIWWDSCQASKLSPMMRCGPMIGVAVATVTTGGELTTIRSSPRSLGEKGQKRHKRVTNGNEFLKLL